MWHCPDSSAAAIDQFTPAHSSKLAVGGLLLWDCAGQADGLCTAYYVGSTIKLCSELHLRNKMFYYKLFCEGVT